MWFLAPPQIPTTEFGSPALCLHTAYSSKRRVYGKSIKNVLRKLRRLLTLELGANKKSQYPYKQPHYNIIVIDPVTIPLSLPVCKSIT